MKLLTSLLLLILLASFVCSSGSQEEKESKEEVKEEFVSQTIKVQEFSASLINTCRRGFRLDASGNCRLVIGLTTSKPWKFTFCFVSLLTFIVWTMMDVCGSTNVVKWSMAFVLKCVSQKSSVLRWQLLLRSDVHKHWMWDANLDLKLIKRKIVEKFWEDKKKCFMK